MEGEIKNVGAGGRAERDDPRGRYDLGGFERQPIDVSIRSPRVAGETLWVEGGLSIGMGEDGIPRVERRRKLELHLGDEFDLRIYESKTQFESPPLEDLLDGFLDLSHPGQLEDGEEQSLDAKHEAVLRFAMRWGMLGICHHGLPSGHSAECTPRSTREEDGAILEWEPVEAWYRYSIQARTLLNVAIDLQMGDPGRVEDWDLVKSSAWPPEMSSKAGVIEVSDVFGKLLTEHWHPGDYFPVSPDDIDTHRAALAECLDHWLRYGGIRIRASALAAESSEPGQLMFLSLDPPDAAASGLFGWIALALAAVMTSSNGIYWCDSCGDPYSPRGRRPQSGRRHYCSTCSEGDRASKRGWARRNRSGRQDSNLSEGTGD